MCLNPIAKALGLSFRTVKELDEKIERLFVWPPAKEAFRDLSGTTLNRLVTCNYLCCADPVDRCTSDMFQHGLVVPYFSSTF